MPSNKKITILLPLSLLAFFMVIIVVVLGAYTRLVDAGLGCPDWPTCYGHLWVPSSAIDIAAANLEFIDQPVEVNKTWPEQIHRIFASSLGLVILVLFAFAIKQRPQGASWKTSVVILVALVSATALRVVIGDQFDLVLLPLALVYFLHLFWQTKQEGRSPKPYKLVALLAGFVILQGWFGMWTVTLNLWPQVVTTHLLGGFTTMSLIWLVVQRSASLRWQLSANHTVNLAAKIAATRTLVILALLMVIIQIALGGWTTSNYAALACPDFPTCHNTWWPQPDFAQGFNIFQQVGPNYLGGLMDNHARTAIHLSHRIGAILTSLIVMALAFRLWTINHRLTKRMALILVAVLAAQISLGISNVLKGLPLMVAVAHNAVGAVLLLSVITACHRIMGIELEVASEKQIKESSQ